MKERRKFLKRLGGMAALFAMASPSQNALASVPRMAGSKEIEGSFVHMVFFWLKDNTENTGKKFLEELRQFIDGVDVIRSKHIGSPADTDREVIDNSYSYCLVVTFDSRKEHDIYQEHRLHQQFIENASPLWKKVLVYDSVKA
jgi:hypothetical protein